MDVPRLAELKNYVNVLLAPIVYYYVQSLASDAEMQQSKKLFLSREGYFLQKAFGVLSNHKSNYFLASRSFLLRITLHNYESLKLAVKPDFTGTLEDFLLKKYKFSRSQVCLLASSKELRISSQDKEYREEFVRVLASRSPTIEEITSHERQQYLSYLERGAFFHGDSVICDLGYSGTIQKLISLLLNKDTKGAYLICSKSGSHDLGVCKATMKGYLKNGVALKEGYLPLDRSMFMECLLTSPNGQFNGVWQDSKKQFQYIFGVHAETQKNFSLVSSAIESLFNTLRLYCEKDIRFSAQEVESVYAALVANSKILLSPSMSKFLSIDDDMAGLGLVRPTEVFG